VSGTATYDITYGGLTTFEGNSAYAWRTKVASVTNGQMVTTDGTSYGNLDGTDVITFGSVAEVLTPLTGTIKTVNVPPLRDKRYSLGLGETWSTTVTNNSTTTFTGLPPVSTSTPTTYTVKYLGRETATVPAGTFTDACKFQIGDDLVYWEAVGSGTLVKSVSQTNTPQTVTLELKSGTLNGSPIN
jgi:hypothetical protein